MRNVRHIVDTRLPALRLLIAGILLALALAACGQAIHNMQPTTTPALGASFAAHTIYVGADPSSSLGSLVALNAQTGATRWTFQMGATYTTPVPDNGIVYTASQDGYAYAINMTTGKQVWRFMRPAPVDGYPALANGIVYYTSDIGSVDALTASSGAHLWSFQMPNSKDHLYSAPAVARGTVYFGAGGVDNGVYALDAATGKLRWHTPLSADAANGDATVVNGLVYVSADDGALYAFDATTGALKWKYKTSLPLEGGATIANGVAYVGSEDHTLYALDATTGKLLWRYTTGGAISGYGSPTVANGTVYIGVDDMRLYALDATTGKLLWTFTASDMVRSSPAVLNGVVFFASHDGSFYALDAAAGKLKWQVSLTGNVEASPVVQ